MCHKNKSMQFGFRDYIVAICYSNEMNIVMGDWKGKLGFEKIDDAVGLHSV